MDFVGVCWAWCHGRARTWRADDQGASLVEYALLLALIGVVCVAAVTFIGDSTDHSLSSAGSALDN